jgi:uncharacterized protein YbjT (DUF2867 family)
MLVLVTGATGFVGRRLVQELQAHHHNVRCLVHTPGRERLFSDRSVEVHYGSIFDPAALTEAFYHVDAVIHLVGIIRETRRTSFDQVHREGLVNVITAALEVNIKHLLHVSAIGATNNPEYAYLSSKWMGEQELVKSGLPYTIFRPSIMFGEGDEFVNSLAGMLKSVPVMPIIGSGRNRFQPIAVEDVAKCLALSVGREDLKGRTIELGGPEQLSYNEMVSVVARTLGSRRLRIHVPVWMMYIAAAIMQRLLPRAPITTDQLRMASLRNVAELDVVENTFGFTPRTMEGNIDYATAVRFRDGVNMLLGSMPTGTRDH